MASSPAPVMPAQVSAASYGRLQLAVTGRNDYTPIENAIIQITDTGNPDNIIEELTTDNSGETPVIELPAPPVSYSLESSSAQPYSEYNFTVQAEGYSNLTISGAQILANVTALQSARLMPLANIEAFPIVVPPHTLYGNFPPKIAEAEIKDVSESGEVVLSRVVVPETIIVHDGPPTDTRAANYYIPFKEYIKNVASSEIYATWPESSIIANCLAIISFTLNRVFTEWYRNKGYDFTITNSTAYDHFFVYGRNIFENYPSWLSHIGYIPQTIYLTDDSIRENIAFGVAKEDIDDERVWHVLEEAQLKDFVKELPGMLDMEIGERGVRLSGGQRQRLGIARALYHNPEILVFDEATSALDTDTETAIMEAIESFHGKKTLVIIAHRLRTIAGCDMIYKVDNGKIVETTLAAEEH